MKAIQIIIGWLLDVWLGDPASLPHPVVLFGKMIARGEHALNKGQHRRLKGALLAITLVLLVFCVTWLLLKFCAMLSPWLSTALQIILIFFCLAGTTLIREVRQVFIALDRSLEEGRQQVARIVGRDASSPYCGARHHTAHCPGSAQSSIGNIGRKPQRWRHSPHVLVPFVGCPRHDGL